MASIRYIVTDIDASVAFYRDKLEFKVDMHNPSKFAALIRDDLTLYLSAPGAGSGGTAGGKTRAGRMEPIHDRHERHRRPRKPVERRWRQIQRRH